MHSARSVRPRLEFSMALPSTFCSAVLGLTSLALLISVVGSQKSCPFRSPTEPPEDSDLDPAHPSCHTTMAGDPERERTFIMVKPDGVQRGLVGEIIKRFEQKGFKLIAIRMQMAEESLLKKHYEDLSARPFFPSLVKYMGSGPVVPMVWEGLNVVKTGRQMMGETNPAQSLPGTIRGDFCIQVGRNIIHGSDSVEAAKKEIGLWFKPAELTKWKSVEDPWLYE